MLHWNEKKVSFPERSYKKQRETFTQLDLLDGNSTKVIKLKLYIEFLFPGIKTKDPKKGKTYLKCTYDKFFPTVYFLFSLQVVNE